MSSVAKEWRGEQPVSADGRPADAVLLDGVLPEGPVKPRGRNRKPKPASLSLFEWELSLNQGSESELVGARCQTASEGEAVTFVATASPAELPDSSWCSRSRTPARCAPPVTARRA